MDTSHDQIHIRDTIIRVQGSMAAKLETLAAKTVGERAAESGTCSECGGVAINAQGPLDCPDCGV